MLHNHDIQYNQNQPVNRTNSGFRIHEFKKRLDPIIDTLELSDTERYIIKKRFVHEVVHYDNKASRCKKTYNGFRFLVTSGSLLIPALLSIQQIEGTSDQFKSNIYWTTWALSLAVTTCNGFIQLFSLDKNYFTYSIIMEKLKTEGWQFLQLSGKYDDYKTHKEAYKYFCNNIETLKIKHVLSEFSGGKLAKILPKNKEVIQEQELTNPNNFKNDMENNMNNQLNNNDDNNGNNGFMGNMMGNMMGRASNMANNLTGQIMGNVSDNIIDNVSGIASNIIDNKLNDNTIGNTIGNTIDNTIDNTQHLEKVRQILSQEPEHEHEIEP